MPSDYKYVTTSVTGFVQQLATGLVPRGYWFYVQGLIPEGKRLEQVDAKLLEKYGVVMTKSARARRKVKGLANVQYLRFENQFILIATLGRHMLFEIEAAKVRDVRRIPIQFHGYSVSFQPGGYLRKGDEDEEPVRDHQYHARVQIARKAYQELTAYFESNASKWSKDRFAVEFRNTLWEPYAPVRQQLFRLLKRVNRLRSESGKEPIPSEVIPYQRMIVKPFEAKKIQEAA